MSGKISSAVSVVEFIENKIADAQEFCAKKNIWFGRVVVFLTVPFRTLCDLSSPVVSVAERVIRAVLNILGAILNKVTFGRLAKTCTLANAGDHIFQGLKTGTWGLVKNTVSKVGHGLICFFVGLYDPKNTYRKTEKKHENKTDSTKGKN